MHEDYIKANQERLDRNWRFVEELRKRGVEPRADQRLQNLRGTPQETAYVEALMASLPHAPTLDDLRSYVGLLGSTKTAFPAQPLIEIYEKAPNDFLRFDVITTLMYSNAEGARPFIEKLLTTPELETYGNYAASMIEHANDGAYYLRIIMRQPFEKHPFAILYGLRRFGTAEDLEYVLKQDLTKCGIAKYKREFEKLYERVVRRLTRLADRKKLRTK